MGGIECPQELNIAVFSFKTKSVGIIREKIGTMGSTECVLVGLNALCDHNGAG